MLKKLLFLPPVLIGAAVLAYFATQKPAPEIKPLQEIAVTVRTITVEAHDLVPRVAGFGAVSPGREWVASSQVSGEIEFVHEDLKKGAILAAGTEIVRISPVDFELAIAQAAANIRASEAKIAELAITVSNTRKLLQIERRTLDVQTRELERKRDLLKRGTVSQSSFDQETQDTLAQRTKIQDLENSLSLIPTQRAVEIEQKAVHEATLKAARLDLARTSIRLPFDARVASVDAEVRQYAQTGQTLASADGIGVAEIEAQIPMTRLGAMINAVVQAKPLQVTPNSLKEFAARVGFEATIILDLGDRVARWPARFARISDTIDPKTRTVGIIATVEGPYAKAVPGRRPPLSKGLFVEMELRTKEVAAQIAVPRSAPRDGALYIANAENRLEIRPVSPALRQDEIVVIREGLKVGERVIVSDLSPAIAGMLLNVVRDDALMTVIRRTMASGRDTR